jgi:hypothetical protein
MGLYVIAANCLVSYSKGCGQWQIGLAEVLFWFITKYSNQHCLYFVHIMLKFIVMRFYM